MSEHVLEHALQFVNDYCEGEYQFGLEALAEQEKAADDPTFWAQAQEQDVYSQLTNKYLRISLYPGAHMPQPGCTLGLTPLNETNLKRRKKRLKKRLVYKASLYSHPAHQFVVRVLISDSTRRFDRPDDIWDLIVQDGQIQLANCTQDICPTCEGMSRYTGTKCKCENNGFVFPPAIDMSGLGELIAIRRLLERPKIYGDLYDAEC